MPLSIAGVSDPDQLNTLELAGPGDIAELPGQFQEPDLRSDDLPILGHIVSPSTGRAGHSPSSVRTVSRPWLRFGNEQRMPAISSASSCKRQLDTTILCAALCCVVRSNRICFAKSLRRDEVRLHALREQELHHVFSTFLRQDSLEVIPLPLQRRTDRGIVGIAAHQDLVLLRRRQFAAKPEIICFPRSLI